MLRPPQWHRPQLRPPHRHRTHCRAQRAAAAAAADKQWRRPSRAGWCVPRALPAIWSSMEGWSGLQPAWAGPTVPMQQAPLSDALAQQQVDQAELQEQASRALRVLLGSDSVLPYSCLRLAVLGSRGEGHDSRRCATPPAARRRSNRAAAAAAGSPPAALPHTVRLPPPRAASACWSWWWRR